MVAKADGTLVQKTHYYPFVSCFAAVTRAEKQPYKYNGKELDKMHGLNLYDYSARYYESAIGRFTTVDPHAEKYYSWSPYAYVMNTPLKYIDPDGKDGIAVFYIDDKGNVSITVNVNIYIYGSGASSSTANQIQTNIMSDWNQGWTYKDSDTRQEYAVSFNVNVDVYDNKNLSKSPVFFSDKNNPSNRDNFIKIGATATDVARSYVQRGDEGKWRGYGVDPSSHEFGHLIGLKDHYTDANGTDPAWAGNIMAEPAGAGVVKQKNIDTLAAPLVKSFNKAMFKKTYNIKEYIKFKFMKIDLNGKILLLLCLMISCNNKIEHSDKELNNKQIRFILNEMGLPDNEREFLLKSDSLQEYQYNLYNIFPQYKEEKIEIKELSWSKKGTKSIIWFYRVGEDWISIDNLTWDTTKISY